MDAQTHTGGVRGTVLAPDGVVPDVPVELVNDDTGTVRSTRSNESGQFAFASVDPGSYVLRAHKRGFAPVGAPVRIGTQEFLTLDLRLETGTGTDEVTVLADAGTTSTASVGTTLTHDVLERLPSPGRNVFMASVTTPGVLHNGDPQFVRQQDQSNSSSLTIAGGPVRANGYTLDGVPITDLRNRAIFIPGVEAVEEVRIQVSTYDAEVGRTSGGVLNTTTRSGSNTWHGGLVGQTRPRWGQGRLFFEQRACDDAESGHGTCPPKPDTHYYLYAGSLGGPVVQDRTFFWASFEGYRSRTTRNTFITLPTERERRGDFSESPVTIYDPLTTRPDGAGGWIRDPFPGNVIPPDRLDPIAQAGLRYMPLPTDGNSLFVVPELVDSADQATLRVDHRFGERVSASATYGWYTSREPEALNYGGEPGENPGDPGEGALYRDVHVLALNGTLVAGPNRVVSLRYGYSSFADDDRVGDFDPATLGFSEAFLSEVTVGFDRDRPWPFQIPGVELRGGLQYAGVDGYPRRQGRPASIKLAPRVGFVWAVDERTVVRGGFGRFWSPLQYGYPDSNEIGTRGFTAITPYVASTDGGLTPCPGCSLADPFPSGIQQPRGNADGIMTGAGGSITFVDQFRKRPRVDHLSLDVQRDLPHGLVASAGYVGSRSDDISIGGSGSGFIDVNQIDPAHIALGPALLDPVPNPFFGDSRFGPLGAQETVPRSQLLRPYPQFTEIWARQVSVGRARYHSLVLRLQRPLRGGWGGHVNWTISRLSDNLFNEGNYAGGGGPPANFRDIDAEWGRSLRDVPHRVNLVASWELPFGEGHRRLSKPGPWRALLGGWTLTVSGYYQSGYPIAVLMDRNETGIPGVVQRPNLTGADPVTPGGTEERLDQWMNPAAWTAPGAFAFGNAPRTDTRVRTPARRQLDAALQKAVRVGPAAVTLRAELINALDQADFHGPMTRLGHPDFGRITGVGGFPRLLQFLLRVGF